jgi:hypothetical protein
MVKLVWFHAQPMNITFINMVTEYQFGGMVPFFWKRTITGSAIEGSLLGKGTIYPI